MNQVAPAKLALKTAIELEANRLIETFEASERAFADSIGLSWDSGRATNQLIRARVDLVTQLTLDSGRPIEMRLGLGFTNLCDEILGNHKPLVILPGGVKTQLAAANPQRGWFAVENIGTGPIKVSVGKSWSIIAPGECTEGTRIVNAEFDELELNQDSVHKGRWLVDRRGELVTAPILAMNKGKAPVEVILYEGQSEPEPEDAQSAA